METVQEHIRNVRLVGAKMHPDMYYPSYPGERQPMLVLPLPPSTNHLYSTVMKGTNRPRMVPVRVKSAAYREWLEAANMYALAQNYPVPFDGYPKGTLWYFTLGVYLPAWTRDISNVVKPVEDWLASRLGLDDRYVRGLCVRRWPVQGNEFAGLKALVSVVL